MQMTAEEAFWTLAQILDVYGFAGYYYNDLIGLKVDFHLTMKCLKKVFPSSYMILTRAGVMPELFMTDWFMCGFVRNLNWACVLRLWDCLFLEGPIVLFKTACLIIDLQLTKNPLNRRKFTEDSMMEIIECLKNQNGQKSKEAASGNHNFWANPILNNPELFIKKVNQVKITELMLQREYIKLREGKSINRSDPMMEHLHVEMKKWIQDGKLPHLRRYVIRQPIEGRHKKIAQRSRINREKLQKSDPKGQGFREVSMNFAV